MDSLVKKECPTGCCADAPLDLSERATTAPPTHPQPVLKMATKRKMVTTGDRDVLPFVPPTSYSQLAPEIESKTASLVTTILACSVENGQKNSVTATSAISVSATTRLSPSLTETIVSTAQPGQLSPSQIKTEPISPEPPIRVLKKHQKTNKQPLVNNKSAKILKLASNSKATSTPATSTTASTSALQVAIKEEIEDVEEEVMLRSNSVRDDHHQLDDEGEQKDGHNVGLIDAQFDRQNDDQNDDQNENQNDDQDDNPIDNQNDYQIDANDSQNDPTDAQNSDSNGDNHEFSYNNSDEGVFRVISLRCPVPECTQRIRNPDKTNLRSKHTLDLLDAHVNQVHHLPVPAICLICNRKYSENILNVEKASADLANHLQNHHSDGAKAKCWKCDKAFVSYISLKRHNFTSHLEGTFGCTKAECGFISITRGDMYRHDHDVHQQIKCPFEGCTRLFKYPSELRRHIMSGLHLGLNEFRCTWPGCNYSGNYVRAYVVNHIKHIHLKPLQQEAQAHGVDFEHQPRQYVGSVSFTDALRDAGKFNFEIE